MALVTCAFFITCRTPKLLQRQVLPLDKNYKKFTCLEIFLTLFKLCNEKTESNFFSETNLGSLRSIEADPGIF